MCLQRPPEGNFLSACLVSRCGGTFLVVSEEFREGVQGNSLLSGPGAMPVCLFGHGLFTF